MWAFFKGLFSMVVSYTISASIYYKHIALMQGWEIPYQRWLENFHLLVLIILWCLAALLLFSVLLMPFTTVKNVEKAKKHRAALNSMVIKKRWYDYVRRFISWVVTIGYGVIGAWGFLAVGLVIKVLTFIASEFAKKAIQDLGDEFDEVKE